MEDKAAKIVQFSGESRREAIVNHLSLDIEEEDEFFGFISELGYSEDDPDEYIISLHALYIDSI